MTACHDSPCIVTEGSLAASETRINQTGLEKIPDHHLLGHLDAAAKAAPCDKCAPRWSLLEESVVRKAGMAGPELTTAHHDSPCIVSEAALNTSMTAIATSGLVKIEEQHIVDHINTTGHAITHRWENLKVGAFIERRALGRALGRASGRVLRRAGAKRWFLSAVKSSAKSAARATGDALIGAGQYIKSGELASDASKLGSDAIDAAGSAASAVKEYVASGDALDDVAGAGKAVGRAAGKAVVWTVTGIKKVAPVAWNGVKYVFRATKSGIEAGAPIVWDGFKYVNRSIEKKTTPP